MATPSTTNVERKTGTNVQGTTNGSQTNRATKKKAKKNIFPNVLNDFRNVTYNFTISAIPNEWLDDARYRVEDPKFIVLKSGGKGTNDIPMSAPLSKAQNQITEESVTKINPETGETYQSVNLTSATEKEKKQLVNNQDIINGFNKSSPGRFDMFIDDVEIHGITTFGKPNGASLATKLSFTVTEPYSINGFIEALHVTSLAAGYRTYTSANFLLTLDFWGYPDNVSVEESTPVKIKKTKKFLLFKFSSVKVDLTSEGTKYQCGGVLFTDRAFGNPNKLKKPISMQGSTIKEILEDLCKNAERQVQESDNESQPGSTKNHDKYEIKFPVLEEGKYKYTGDGNIIGKSKISEFNKSNVLSVMPDQASSTVASPRTDGRKVPSTTEVKQDTNKLKYTPNSNIKIQFNEGRNISECIEAVIVDSQYVKGLLENFKPDDNGLVNYFLITPEVTNQAAVNPQTKDYYKKYTFIVTEYKIHYTRVPGYQSFKFDVGNISNIIYKEYNYMYTGKNIDVLNFKLDFNNLYFESIPSALGNNNQVGAKDSAAKDDTPKVEYKTEGLDKVSMDQTPTPPIMTSPTPINPSAGGTGGQLTDDPYQLLARNLHDAVVNAKVSGAQGTLEILGDPFFISTTGTGNYKARLMDGYLNITEDNEIDPTFGEMYILVNFRNPVDVNQFEKVRVPFSGVYKITTIKSFFRSGIFRQEFSLIRVPAQLPEETNITATDVKDVAVTVPDPTNGTIKDTTPAVAAAGIRPDPSQLSILTVNNPMYDLAGKFLNTISQGMSQLSAASSIYSLATSRLTEGIRLASTTLNSPLEQLSGLKSAANTLGNSLGNQATAVENAFSTFASNSPVGGIVKSLSNTADLVGGIGKKLESQVKEQALGKLAGTLGIDVSKLDSVAREKFKGLKDKAEELSVNLPRAVASGLKINTIPLDNFKNIPSFPPDTIAPPPEIPLQDLKGLDIAKAFGVTNLTKLPGLLTPAKINEAIAASDMKSQLLSAKNALTSDLSTLKDKFGSISQQATTALGQASQTLESAQSTLGNLNINTAVNLYGSTSAGSPLDKLISPVTQQIKIPPVG